MQSKGLLRVFSNTTVQEHQFFGAQLYRPTLNPYAVLEKPQLWRYGPLSAKWCFYFSILYVCHSFSFNEQLSFNFMTTVTAHGDFGAEKIKFDIFSIFPPLFWWSDGTGYLFPNHGSHSGPLHWEHWVLSTGPPGEFLPHMYLEPNWDLNIADHSISKSDHFKENIYLPLKDKSKSFFRPKILYENLAKISEIYLLPTSHILKK